MSPAAPAVTVAVIDYGMGNRRSVEKALTHVGARSIVSGDPTVLAGADGLVLPGVGAFARGMANLRASGLDAFIRRWIGEGRPLLGVCLGMQLLFDRSTELGGDTGLGLIPGEVRAIDAHGLRIPHIGWNEVTAVQPSRLLTADAPFYHVHSYCVEAADARDVVGTTEYGERFATVVARGNVLGVQFHPEKSSRDGLSLLRRFVELAAEAAGRPLAVAS